MKTLNLSCRPLPAFEMDDWASIERAFATADSCELGQAWREAPEPDFQVAQVRVGWREESPNSGALWVYAELRDRDIFNAATHLNDATYAKGDIFEIFVRPIGQEDYYEFHVTPENQNLQLHWPNDQAVWSCEDTQESLQPYFVSEALLQSRTQVQRENNFWRVLASVPFSVAREGSTPVGSGSTPVGDAWAFSFSRYDCTRGVEMPVWSASSPHPEPKFHRQQEWGRLTFKRGN